MLKQSVMFCSMDQVKGVLTLQGEALTQAVSVSASQALLLSCYSLTVVNVFPLFTGHKPEGCKEQPSATLSVQRGQNVEAAAGTVWSV